MRRHADDAENGAAGVDEADIDGERVTSGGELTGAVQRVDEPVGLASFVVLSGGSFLLGDDGVAWGRGA